MIRRIFFISAMLVSYLHIMATHIVGGELNYKCLGNNQYQIILTVYRDCYNGVPPFDDPASVGIFDANNKLVQNVLIKFTSKQTLPPTMAQANVCVKTPSNVCVEVTQYTATVTLPPIAGGYQLAYQRCCRNQTITNLTNPGNQGATYYARIPDQTVATCNSNPKFNNWPPIFICVNNPVIFDHSAIDTDGDSIVYSLCSPFTGATGTNSQPQPPNAPPYTPVTFKNPYTPSNPMGGPNPLTINPQTGLITGVPPTIGQFVIGICADEYRNGQLISTTKRDFQFNVINCQPDVSVAVPDVTVNCNSKVATFTNNSTGATKFFWNFGDTLTLADTSTTKNPTYTYPVYGSYEVMLVAYSNLGPQCNDTLYGYPVTVDSCQPCAMTLSSIKTDAVCGVSACNITGPPVLDAIAGKTIGAGNPPADSITVSWNHTVTAVGTNPLLIVQVSSTKYRAVSVTYGGTPLQSLGYSGVPIAPDSVLIEMWYLVNPPTGTNMVVVTFPPGSGTFNPTKRGESFSFTNVNQTTPFGPVVDTTGMGCASIIVPSGANELVLDQIGKDYFYPPTVPGSSPTQTQQYSLKISFDPACGGSTKPGQAPQDTMQWTWNSGNCAGGTGNDNIWAGLGVSIKPACSGGPTPGSATVIPASGTPGYNYSWSPTGGNGATAGNLTAGTYTVTVIDAQGCLKTTTIVVDANSTMNLNANKTDISTCGAKDGVATINPSGGTAPYTISWSTGVTGATSLTGLGIGSVTAFVTDSAGCTKSNTFTFTAPIIITATTTKTDNRCKAPNNGTITALPTSGVGPYSYTWSTKPVQTDSAVTGLKSGYYIVTVTDANGCTGTAGTTIADSSLTVSATSTDSKCAGVGSGTATVTAVQGTPTYSYAWSTIPIQTTATATGLTAGTYTAMVMDAVGCMDSVTVTIAEPAPMRSETKNTSTLSCPSGTPNGSAQVLVGGGAAPYTYSWSCSGLTTDSVTGLPAGLCKIAITDSLGCITTDSVDIIFPNPVSILSSASNVSCSGDSTGSVTASGLGGTPIYSYLWSTTPAQTTQSVNNLKGGTYTVTITDSKGCTASSAVTINVPTALNMIKTVTNAGCNVNNGTINVTTTGGTPGYTYSWNTTPAQTDSTAINLSPGTYLAQVTDANGCKDTISAIVTGKVFTGKADFKFDITLSCTNGVDAAFTNLSTGGITSYLWIFGDGTTSTDANPVHNYPFSYNTTIMLVVLDGGCADTLKVPFATKSFDDYLRVPNVFTPNGDGKNDCFEVTAMYYAVPCVKLTVYDRWGLKMYDNENGTCWDGKHNGKDVPDGTYFYLIKIGDTGKEAHGALTLLR